MCCSFDMLCANVCMHVCYHHRWISISRNMLANIRRTSSAEWPIPVVVELVICDGTFFTMCNKIYALSIDWICWIMQRGTHRYTRELSPWNAPSWISFILFPWMLLQTQYVTQYLKSKFHSLLWACGSSICSHKKSWTTLTVTITWATSICSSIWDQTYRIKRLKLVCFQLLNVVVSKVPAEAWAHCQVLLNHHQCIAHVRKCRGV